MNKLGCYISRIIRVLLFIIGIIVVYMAVDYALDDDSDSRSRVAFHEFYEMEDVDYLIIGPSHSNYGVSATVMTEELGKSVFNLASPSQDFVNGYYLLKECLEKKEIERVFCEISISRFCLLQTNETSTFIISDYIESQKNRLELIYDACTPSMYVNAFSKLRRNFNLHDIPQFSEVGKIIANKKSDAYKNFEGTDLYFGRGQWVYDIEMGYGDTLAYNLKSRVNTECEGEINQKELEYLQKIIDLCKENNIELTFYIMPYFEYYMYINPNYDKLTNMAYEIADKNNIPMVDMNLVKDEYMDLKISDFRDTDHLNINSREIVGKFLSEYIKNPDGDYFYSSVQEKYPQTPGIKWVGYERYFMVGDEPKLVAETDDRWNSVRIITSAAGYEQIPVKSRMWYLRKSGYSGEYYEEKEFKGKQLDEYRTQFSIPENLWGGSYKIQLLDPETDEVLYETISTLDMN